MKKPLYIICFILLFVAIMNVAANAHSGGTDSSGGHYVKSTGEYHFHHGFPAHQHTDIDGDGEKDCPYEFIDIPITVQKRQLKIILQRGILFKVSNIKKCQALPSLLGEVCF